MSDVIPAGDFSAWLAGLDAALRGAGESDVPCGDCTACCRASQFVHVGPDETDALARIPAALLFPAPGAAAGHLVLGYDERGHCPMLVEDACSIYAHRPRACRTYDCRVFAAAGVEPDPAQAAVAERARRWEFAHPRPIDRARHDAVRAAAGALATDPEGLAAGEPPRTATRRALAAIELHERFLVPSVDDQEGGRAPVQQVKREMRR